MIRKPCPWCDKPIKLSQLGTRPVEAQLRWYQFSQTERVCPFCAKPVAVAGKSVAVAVGFILPLFIFIFLELFGVTDGKLPAGVAELVWGAAFVGLLLFYLLMQFKKA